MAKKWSSGDIEAAITAAFRRLGYPTVKSEQLEAAKEFVKGKDKDIFVSIPTGSGKLLCYGCLPFVYDSLCGSVDGNKSLGLVWGRDYLSYHNTST